MERSTGRGYRTKLALITYSPCTEVFSLWAPRGQPLLGNLSLRDVLQIRGENRFSSEGKDLVARSLRGKVYVRSHIHTRPEYTRLLTRTSVALELSPMSVQQGGDRVCVFHASLFSGFFSVLSTTSLDVVTHCVKKHHVTPLSMTKSIFKIAK